MGEISLWSLLAFIAATNGMLLLAVGIGAYAVYKTKREDGYVFKAPQPQNRDKPVLLDEGIGAAYDLSEEEPQRVDPDVMDRNHDFLKNFFTGEGPVDEKRH